MHLTEEHSLREQITIDYALNLFQGKFIPSEPVKPIKPVSKPKLPTILLQLAEQLDLSVFHLSVIAALDSNTIESCLDLMWSFSGIKSILAARAIQDYRDVLSLTRPIKFTPQSMRSLLRRLGLTDVLKGYYRYMVTQ
jgi:hypothetical protein